MKEKSLLLVILFVSFSVYKVDAQREPDEKSIVIKPTKVTQAIYHDVFGPLSDLPALTDEEIEVLEANKPKKERNEELKERLYPFFDSEPKGPDPGWQKQMGQNSGSKVTLQNFAGQNSTSNPPDCNGTVGPNHYMQTINVYYTIYNKTGTLLAGPTAMNTLFSGVPGSTVNDGDPIIMYDEQADRWLAAEFSGVYSSPDYMLIAVSTTNDPTGTWNRWSFLMNGFPDYMKFGVWEDGYYMGTNTSSGDDIYVFERSVMIAGGASPQVVQFDNPNRPNSGFHCVLPMDNDGAFAPVGTPGQFITINDGAWSGSDQLWIYNLNVNWTTPTSSSFSRVQTINVAPFDANFGTDWENIAQQGVSQELDAIPQVLMNRAQYRNWGTSQSLVCCHAVDVDNTDHAGIRWYELENTGSGWSIRQFGTYAPDDHSRWMGSIAMNNVHEIGLGYSVSSSSMYPAIRYCGQSASNNALANGILDMTETSIQVGPASQTSSERWGDYANIALDPNNDHDFWFTTEYAQTTSQKRTRIAAFQFSSSSQPPVADFTADNLYPANSMNWVNFSDASSFSPTSWSWTITPGTHAYVGSTSNTSQNPSVSFTQPGAYTVTLYVQNASGNDSEIKTDYIHVGQPGLWTGNTSINWNTNTNWENHEVPSASTDVSITSAPHLNWPTKTGNLTVGTDCNSLNMSGGYTELTVTGDLTISTGKTFYVDPTGIPNINIGGHWVKQGTFTEGLSTVKFYGTTNSNISLSKGSAKGIITTLDENFDGGSLPSGWSATNTNTSAWNVDSSPNPPGYQSASYSLNYNNGTDFDDGAANTGIVTTAAIDNSLATSTSIQFYYQLETEDNTTYDWVQIEVLRASDNVALQTVGGLQSTSIPDISTWTQHTITGNALVIAESSIKLRFNFTAVDGIGNSGFGWFIDDLHVEKNVPITSTTFFNLTAEKTGGGIVTTGVSVDVVNDFEIKAGSYFTNNSGNTLNIIGNTYFEANAGGMASFIDYGTTTVSGQTFVEQYILYTPPYQYHAVSSPISDATINTYYDMYLYKYDEPTNDFVSIYLPTTMAMNVGEGYYVTGSNQYIGSTTVSFQSTPPTGALNTGNVTLSGFTMSGSDPLFKGFRLAGNPFPCALQWNSNWSMSNMSGWMVVIDNGSYSGYHTDGTPWQGGNGIIPSTQGFWVRATSTSASLTIPASERMHSSQTFHKGTKDYIHPIVRLEAKSDDLFDEAVVVFHPEGHVGFDDYYDLTKFTNPEGTPQFYTVTEGMKYAFNVLPKEYIDAIIPLHFEINSAGLYQIEATEINNIADEINVYLEDLKEGTITELKTNPIYEFDHNLDNDPHRFNLHFKESWFGIEDNLTSKINIYSAADYVYILTPEMQSGEVFIYDMLGQEILTKRITESDLTKIRITNGSAYYLVKFQSDEILVTEKVFIR